MPRQQRIEYPGAVYHVMARGDRRESIVQNDEDRQMWWRTLAEACEKTGWRVHAWVLMSNHFHLALETPEPNLVAGMRWMQNTYTRRLNTRHHLWGHVFGGRYKAVLVESDEREMGGGYLGALIDYIHLNPVRAGLVSAKEGKGLLDYRWNSLAQGYAVAPSRRPDWLETELGFHFAQVKDTVSGRRQMVEGLERRILLEGARDCGRMEIEGQTLNSTLVRGWYWGSEAFRERVLKLLHGKESRKPPSNRTYRSSRLAKDEDQSRAEELVQAGMRRWNLTEKELPLVPGSDPRKVAIALQLHEETTVAQGWIATRLHMRSAANVSQQVRRYQKEGKPKQSRFVD